MSTPTDAPEPVPVPDAARALEGLLQRRRWLGGALLNADMFDRWGPKSGPEYDALQVEAAAATTEHAQVTAALTALSAETLRRAPEAVRAWAAAHIDLLAHFAATRSGSSFDETAVFVAGQETEAWRQVAAGELPFVDENVFYVHVDAARHAAFFGPVGPPD